MKKILIGFCILLVACNNNKSIRIRPLETTHLKIKGTITKDGIKQTNIKVILTSTACETITTTTNNEGAFKLKQLCRVSVPYKISILSTLTYISYQFNVSIITADKTYTWPIFNPSNIEANVDLTEKTVCIFRSRGLVTSCSNLVLPKSLSKKYQKVTL